ncbi:tetratricopeptide repeat protein [Magnetospirillum sp. 15-1]|uniref:tetratricopeptide repeat protein n=1 Tax=Magnetospirillum sp. 15-1 TaxID=1979370 RepID=UPI000BBBBC08|nr:tetratricopeptide repeat protein [Magnetospirillum sp. 15-1]
MTDKHDDAAADLLIKEVDEDLRQEELNKLWKKHGGLLTGAAVVLVLAVAGWQGWQGWEAKQRQAASSRYSETAVLVEQGKKDEAAEVLGKLVAEGPKGYRLLAELRRADMLQQAGDFAGAAALYGKVAADGSVDKVYRDMSAIRAAYLVLDSGDAAAIEKSVEPLAAEASSWRHSAREILALVALKRGDAPRAAELFAKIAEDAAAPQGLRTRAAEMLAATGQRARS